MQVFFKTVSLALIGYVIFKTQMVLQPQALTNLNVSRIYPPHLTLIPALSSLFIISVNGIFPITQAKQNKTLRDIFPCN